MSGIDSIKQDIQDIILNPIQYPQLYAELRIEPARGVLFTGPPGTGKTYLAHAIGNELPGVTFYPISSTELVSGVSGQSELKIRQLFESALESAPSLIFIDEIDAITPKRSQAGKEMERRIVSQLMSSLDELPTYLESGKLVMLIAATNRIDSIETTLRRNGRFDREISFGIPNETQRREILENLVSRVKTAEDVSIQAIARLTPGYVGADISSLINEAGSLAIKRLISKNSTNLQDSAVTAEDFTRAVALVQPSSKREGFSTIPDTTWDDIGGLQSLKDTLHYAIVNAIENPEMYKALGTSAAAGVLLYGPPGCGKTLVAKAVANQSKANFIAVNGPELLNKYVGESERAIRLLFQRARDSSPCIIFFDEIDSICARRGQENAATERVVNQLLTELNGLEGRGQVFVIAATNRLDIIDHAILRPGRLDKPIYVSLPGKADRSLILQTLIAKSNVEPTVDVSNLADSTERFSGADLAALMHEAAICAIKDGACVISPENFTTALASVRPSVTEEDLAYYEAIVSKRSKYSSFVTP